MISVHLSVVFHVSDNGLTRVSIPQRPSVAFHTVFCAESIYTRIGATASIAPRDTRTLSTRCTIAK